MTQVIHISISYTSSQELLITAEMLRSLDKSQVERSGDQASPDEVRAYSPMPTESADLIAELRSGRATQRALSQSREMVSETLWAGEVGNFVHRALSSAERSSDEGAQELKLLLMLSTPNELYDWPWELVYRPHSERALLLDRVELVRLAGAPLSPAELSALDVERSGRVITKSSELFKFSAMRAATAHITRRYDVPIEVTHDLSDQSNTRHLLTHLYAVDKRGLITLESSSDDPQLVSESPLARQSYLLNVTPLISNAESRALRDAGSLALVTRQFEQSVKTRAESDRAFYHALGSGFTLARAMQWARQALARGEGLREGDYQWASLRLTTAMIKPADQASSEALEPIALMSFPPEFKSNRSSESSSESSSEQGRDADQTRESSERSKGESDALIRGHLAPLDTRRARPLSGERFVLSTVELIQKSQRSGDPRDKAALALRTPIMRRLSDIVQRRGLKPNPQLSRSAQLSTQLIEASVRADEPLRLPEEWLGRVERLSSSLGLRVDPIAQAARSLITSPALWICGADALTRLRLARGLCEDVFETLPYEPLSADVQLGERHPHDQSTGDVFGVDDGVNVSDESVSANLSQRVYLGLTATAEMTASGASEASVSSPADALIGERQASRLLCVGFQRERNAWCLYKRAWSVIDQADTVNVRHRRRAGVAIRQGELFGGRASQEGYTPASVKLPQDSRVIYLSDAPPSVLDESEVLIYLEPEVRTLPDLWLNQLRQRFITRGLSEAETRERTGNSLTEGLSATLALAVLLDIVSITRAYDALCYATYSGVNQSTCTEAIELYIEPQLNASHNAELTRDCLFGFASLDVARYERGWRAIFSDAAPLELPSACVIADFG